MPKKSRDELPKKPWSENAMPSEKKQEKAKSIQKRFLAIAQMEKKRKVAEIAEEGESEI